MLRLRTFGAVQVLDGDGRPLGGAAGQRRVLAFLAVLAVAGDAGLSRDKIAALLWPEADAERARHSVTQALYAARRALGVDDLFEAGGDVRLAPGRLTSDVQEFERAVAGGELSRAVALYQGPFLDGFHLPGSSEFEPWASARRQAYEDRAVGALETLAAHADGAGDVRAATEWWRRLAAVRPLDARVAVALMETLARAGDRAGALRHAEIHGALLQAQLGVAADPDVAALAARLREPVSWRERAAQSPAATRAGVEAASPPGGPSRLRPATARSTPTTELMTAPMSPLTVEGGEPASDDRAWDASATGPGAAIGEPSSGRPPLDHASATVAAEGRSPAGGGVAAPAASPDRRPRRGWLAPLAAAALVLAGGGAWWAWDARRPALPSGTDATLRQTLVVAPFRVAGASEALAYLREGVVELLSTRLADDSVARAVDAGAVLGAWRRSGLAREVEVPRDTVVRLAARLGAERVVVGSVVGTPQRTVLSASLVRVADGAVVGSASVEGTTDSLTALVDRLAARLLVEAAGEAGALAEQTTRSLPALRAFLAGQAAFRRHAYDDALRAYERALVADTTFALAALQLVRSADRIQSVEDRSWALALAWHGRAELGERDRTLLTALAGPAYPAPSTGAALRAAWERAARLTPDRAEGWYELGAQLLQGGALVGATPGPMVSALRRAAELDPGDAPARRLLAEVAARGAADRGVGGLAPIAPPWGAEPWPASPLAPDAVLADSTGPLAPAVRWRAALARGDARALARLRDTMPRLGRANLRAIAQAAQHDAVALADAGRAVGWLRARAVRPVDRVEAAEAALALALNTGRLRDADAALDDLTDLLPGSTAALRLRVLASLYAGADGESGAAAAAELTRRLREVAAEPAPTGAGVDAALNGAARRDAPRLGSPRRTAAAPTASRPDGLAPAAVRARPGDACVVALWRLERADTSDVAETARGLRGARAPAEVSPTERRLPATRLGETPPALCAALLEAALAVTLRQPDAGARLARLDALALAPATAGEASGFAALLLARLHARLGDSASALTAARRRPYLVGWPRYLAATLRAEGDYAAAVGDASGARAAYARYLALREAPDAPLVPEREDVRRALEALDTPTE